MIVTRCKNMIVKYFYGYGYYMSVTQTDSVNFASEVYYLVSVIISADYFKIQDLYLNCPI